MGVPLQQARLLIVNRYDERAMYAEAFRSRGVRVNTSTTMRGALSYAVRTRPDVIIIGAVLPDGSGLELARRLKTAKATADTPIILLSGFTDEPHLRAMTASGADAIVVKPCAPDDLLTRVDTLIRARADAGASTRDIA